MLLNLQQSIVVLLLQYSVALLSRDAFRSSQRRSDTSFTKRQSFTTTLTMSSMATETNVVPVKRWEPDELFWLTPEGLSIEVLASNLEMMKELEEAERKVIRASRWKNLLRMTKSFLFNINDTTTKNYVALRKKPPILFIHGSFHAGWCFAENYIDYFSQRGHQCFAVSLRGTSTTGMPPGDPGELVRIEDHVADMKNALLSLRENMFEVYGNEEDPIIVAHSFGGMVAMKLLEEERIRDRIRGVCLLCSVPPSGNGPMTQRFLFKRFFDSLYIVWGFVFKAATTNVAVCRRLFFDQTVPDVDIERYMGRLRADSRVTLDLSSLINTLPSVTSMASDGKATWLSPLTASKESTTTNIPSTMVIGAEKDFVVDREGVVEAATYLGVEPEFVKDTYHDVMLGPKWTKSADLIAKWIDTLLPIT